MRTRRLALALALAAPLALAAAPARAFCGFYVGGADATLFNNATLVVLMREGTRTVLSMQNNYQGPPAGFAMVVPVPIVLQEENVKTLPNEVFAHVDQLAAPRLVEYWEQDPCMPPRPSRKPPSGVVRQKSGAPPPKEPASLGVTIEAEFEVGEYQIVILSAEDSTGLDTWLRREKYAIPAGAEPLLRPYVEEGMKFFVAKVDPAKVKFDAQGQATLSPLRFHYDSKDFRLPVRLGMINSGGTQDLLVHILARGQRYELANYPNVTIPTNIDLDDQAKGRFGEFYAALFDATLARNPGAVVTEYAWDAGTCDPCPGPVLTGADMATLGADVLPAADELRAPWGVGGFVLTRLHARYGQGALAEDLVFRQAPPIVGGREWRNGDKLEKGAREDRVNNFQGRYAIRHPWTGPITCQDPKRGRWGGPPEGSPKPAAQAAKDLAFAPRGTIELAAVVREEIPELGLMVADGALVQQAVVMDRLPEPEVAEAPPAEPSQPEVAEAPPVEPPPAKQGCACAASDGAPPRALLALGLLGLLARRRRQPA